MRKKYSRIIALMATIALGCSSLTACKKQEESETDSQLQLESTVIQTDNLVNSDNSSHAEKLVETVPEETE